jgi:hypothetical protein
MAGEYLGASFREWQGTDNDDAPSFESISETCAPDRNALSIIRSNASIANAD